MPPVSTYRSGFRPGLFASQSVIVSGGGSGMGRCTAHEFAALRASVALVGRRRRIVIMETRPAGKGEPEGSLAAGMVHLGTEPTRKSTLRETLPPAEWRVKRNLPGAEAGEDQRG